MWKYMPKVELHLHLDCSLSYDFVRRFVPAITNHDYQNHFVAPAKCRDLAEFLTFTKAPLQLMQTEYGLRQSVSDLAQQLQSDHVIYAEIRFAPLLHVLMGLSADDVVEIVADEISQQAQHTHIQMRLILCTLLHFNERQAMITADLVQRFMKGGVVVGFDVAGDEANFALDNQQKSFEILGRAGVALTAHAGEYKGAKNVWNTLTTLYPKRLGHGVRSIEDPALISYLRKHQIHLEVCPTSNIQTGVYSEYRQHPVHKLLQAGVSLGINTDGRALNNTSLCNEYQRLHETFGWSGREFYQCNHNALQAAFIDSDMKAYLSKKLVSA